MIGFLRGTDHDQRCCVTYCPPRCPAHYYANSFPWQGSVLLTPPPHPFLSRRCVALADYLFRPRFGPGCKGSANHLRKADNKGDRRSQLLPNSELVYRYGTNWWRNYQLDSGEQQVAADRNTAGFYLDGPSTVSFN